MIMKKNKVELLAPAKNKDCAFAAINAGADAVYIGASAFGARKKAGNSLEDIQEIVRYAHKFLVKVYVTLNTIIFDEEIESVEKLVWKLYEIGVDAIIFQDFSFFEMTLPPIPLHASTQCNNDDIEKIKFLHKCNVERVVLPREFSIEQIREITNNIDIETEVFVHGALCVSYSGQCYLSQYIGGRSANRGECAQPCRKKYSLVDENDNLILDSQYLLSMKDNNLVNHLKELIDAGVDSLKIEGRLKDKEYVANVVSAYRQALDAISPKLRTSVGRLSSDFYPNLNKTFNRGYTNFYFDSIRKDFINPFTPKYIGEYIGEVISIKGNTLVVSTKLKLNPNDKISYFEKKGELSGTTITMINGKFISVLSVGSIRKGTKLYRNYDFEFNEALETAEFLRKIPADIRVSNNGIAIRSIKEFEIFYPFQEKYEIANNIEKSKETVIKQLSKLGDTEFYVSQIKVLQDFNLFIPVSKLNKIRREAILQLKNLLEENYPNGFREVKFDCGVYPYKSLNYKFNISNNLAQNFYEKCGCDVNERAFECESPQSEIVLMKTKHCLRHFAGMCKKNCKDNLKLFLKDDFGNKYPLKFDCQNCVMNIMCI